VSNRNYWVVFFSLFAGCTPQGAATPGASAPSSAPVAAAEPVVPAGNNLLKNSTFDTASMLPWMTSFSAPADGNAEVKQGALCLNVTNKGENAWDAQLRHREMVIQKGHSYTVQFHAWSSAPTHARPKVGMQGPPYKEYWSSTIALDSTPKLFKFKFKGWAPDDPTAEFAFHLGGEMAIAAVPFTVCIDDVRLDDPDFTPSTAGAAKAVPKVFVNELGYLPNAAKIATVKSDATSPLDWELLNSAGASVAKGKTTVFGADPASGDHVQEIDFSSFKTVGKGYTLKVGSDTSFPFAIDPNLYKPLKYDALSFFYQTRSGIAITQPYVSDPSLTRPAGHLSDKAVKCMPGTGCDYTLDASGGWYDAGDQGKYVVNGGIATWTLLDEYERAKYLGSSVADFGDGKLAIPEHKNGTPDLLDEARWELEFMLRMQVPPGNPKAGMVHHKLHDEHWTALGLAPQDDKETRYLHAPSTAATLNLAATAAQGARIWKTLDPTFSAKCLHAAEIAWAAAKANPAVFALAKDTTGGGAYEDDKVSDDFYWAAAELFITTGKPEYKDFIASSPHAKGFRTDAGGQPSSMNWADTDALGQISLAIVPNSLPPAEVKEIRSRIVAAADNYVKAEAAEGYRTPLRPTDKGKYAWGSNSTVLNNLVVIALAYDFTKQPKFLNAVATGMDYLLGRNPLGKSYVSGYGEIPLEHPHHRFWAHQANASFPNPPKGLVSGGPNSGIEDPYAKAAGLAGCAPEKCYVDNIEAYSVNEIAINWNAPLAWVAAFLDEKAHAPASQ
jgi:endoglucanase